MPPIEVSEQLDSRLRAFKPLVDAVIEEETDWETYLELVMNNGLEVMLYQIIGDPSVAITTLAKLAELEPEPVFSLLTLAWEKSSEAERAEAKARLRNPIGFQMPQA